MSAFSKDCDAVWLLLLVLFLPWPRRMGRLMKMGAWVCGCCCLSRKIGRPGQRVAFVVYIGDSF